MVARLTRILATFSATEVNWQRLYHAVRVWGWARCSFDVLGFGFGVKLASSSSFVQPVFHQVCIKFALSVWILLDMRILLLCCLDSCEGIEVRNP